MSGILLISNLPSLRLKSYYNVFNSWKLQLIFKVPSPVSPTVQASTLNFQISTSALQILHKNEINIYYNEHSYLSHPSTTAFCKVEPNALSDTFQY